MKIQHAYHNHGTRKKMFAAVQIEHRFRTWKMRKDFLNLCHHTIKIQVAGIISKEMQKESVVVFDEAHNIDSVCIEALSVSVRRQTLEGATRNLSKMSHDIDRLKTTDAGRLRSEYNRLVQGLAQRGNLSGMYSHHA